MDRYLFKGVKQIRFETPEEKKKRIQTEFKRDYELFMLKRERSKEQVVLNKLRKMQEIKKVDLLKVDTEGTELNVFKSGIAIINKFRPLIFFEYSFSGHLCHFCC